MLEWNSYWIDNAVNKKIPNLGRYKKYIIHAAFYDYGKYVCVFFSNLKNCLLAAYNIPECKRPCKARTSFSKIPRLGELYFACAVLSDLACIYNTVELAKQTTQCTVERLRFVTNGLHWAIQKLRMLVLSVTKNSPLELDEDYAIDFKCISAKLLCLQTYHRLLVVNLEASHRDIFYYDYFLPFSSTYPDVKWAVDHFVEGNYRQLEKIITILNDKSQVIDSENKFCRRCGKRENSKTGKFLQCKQCIESKFPEMNYFCSKKCEEIMLKSEHLAEHLEFELGLAEFSTMNFRLDE
jgi:hypothetical protein